VSFLVGPCRRNSLTGLRNSFCCRTTLFACHVGGRGYPARSAGAERAGASSLTLGRRVPSTPPDSPLGTAVCRRALFHTPTAGFGGTGLPGRDYTVSAITSNPMLTKGPRRAGTPPRCPVGKPSPVAGLHECRVGGAQCVWIRCITPEFTIATGVITAIRTSRPSSTITSRSVITGPPSKTSNTSVPEQSSFT
jgi:hypothetical protein